MQSFCLSYCLLHSLIGNFRFYYSLRADTPFTTHLSQQNALPSTQQENGAHQMRTNVFNAYLLSASLSCRSSSCGLGEKDILPHIPSKSMSSLCRIRMALLIPSFPRSSSINDSSLFPLHGLSTVSVVFSPLSASKPVNLFLLSFGEKQTSPTSLLPKAMGQSSPPHLHHTSQMFTFPIS